MWHIGLNKIVNARCLQGIHEIQGMQAKYRKVWEPEWGYRDQVPERTSNESCAALGSLSTLRAALLSCLKHNLVVKLGRT